jgi:uncharacterized protein (DUF2252 family)
MTAGKIDGRPVFIRELVPQDLEIVIERLTVEEAMKAASFMTGVVGKAHSHQLDEPARMSWSKEPERDRSKTLDTAGWLWSSVVALIERHEVAYCAIVRPQSSFAWGLFRTQISRPTTQV